MDDSESTETNASRQDDVYFDRSRNDRGFSPKLFYADEEEYRSDYRYRGMAVVVNNSHFPRQESSSASTQETDLITDTLKGLQFKVQLHCRLQESEIKRVFLKVCGGEDVVWSQPAPGCPTRGWDEVDCPRDDTLNIGDIAQLFNNRNCPHLTGKPKLFFVQGVGGGSFDSGEILPDRNEVVDACVMRQPADQKVQIYDDFLVMCASPSGPGYQRNRRVSPFVTLVCQSLKNCRSQSLLRLLTRVCGVMSHLKPVPCIYSKLTRDVVFRDKYKYM